ncbi:unnamed protein product [Blepharisma stoltei]|uniref:Uncharacterized protein n=1 Tax=Blepharisma stoltei TaxID=1481888 RepID=A0AAU9J1T9_9CILI|nr:unnamed protein product [Blepharisma stoltei]
MEDISILKQQIDEQKSMMQAKGLNWTGVDSLYTKILEIRCIVDDFSANDNIEKSKFYEDLAPQLDELENYVIFEKRCSELIEKEREKEAIEHLKQMNELKENYLNSMLRLEDVSTKLVKSKNILLKEIEKNKSIQEENDKLGYLILQINQEKTNISEKYQALTNNIQNNREIGNGSNGDQYDSLRAENNYLKDTVHEKSEEINRLKERNATLESELKSLRRQEMRLE